MKFGFKLKERIRRRKTWTQDNSSLLRDQLGLTKEELLQKKKNFYGRKFGLWVPMVHDFDVNNDDNEVEKIELLPVGMHEL